MFRNANPDVQSNGEPSKQAQNPGDNGNVDDLDG